MLLESKQKHLQPTTIKCPCDKNQAISVATVLNYTMRDFYWP